MLTATAAEVYGSMYWLYLLGIGMFSGAMVVEVLTMLSERRL